MAGLSMGEGRPLLDRRVLVVEDEFFVAEDLTDMLRSVGADVVGPVAALPAAMRLVEETMSLDAAILDINLGGQPVFPLTEALGRRRVPMMFLTGYGPESIPHKFSAVLVCEKPLRNAQIVENLIRIIG